MDSNYFWAHVNVGSVFACLLTAVVIFAGACSSEDTGEKPVPSPGTKDRVEKKTSKSPAADVVRSYLDAMLAEDREAMAGLMTPTDREAAQSFEHRVTVQAENATFKVGDTEIDGDRASVPVTLVMPERQPPRQ